MLVPCVAVTTQSSWR